MDYKRLAEDLFESIARHKKIPMEEPREFTRGEMGILVYLHFNKEGITSGDLVKACQSVPAESLQPSRHLRRKG